MEMKFKASDFVSRRLNELVKEAKENGDYNPGEMSEEEYKECLVNLILELALDEQNGIM